MRSDPQLILASTSPYRRQLLERLGVSFRCVAPEFHEDLYKDRGEPPVTLARMLASGKAWNVAQTYPEAIVIGSDQLATIEGEVLGKPGSPERAVEQLARLSGRTHELITAVCVITNGEEIVFHNTTKLTMRPLSRAEMMRYVARDNPIDCAGSYKIEAGGIALFERIETEDFTAITGLPLIELVGVLRGIGVRVL